MLVRDHGVGLRPGEAEPGVQPVLAGRGVAGPAQRRQRAGAVHRRRGRPAARRLAAGVGRAGQGRRVPADAAARAWATSSSPARCRWARRRSAPGAGRLGARCRRTPPRGRPAACPRAGPRRSGPAAERRRRCGRRRGACVARRVAAAGRCCWSLAGAGRVRERAGQLAGAGAAPGRRRRGRAAAARPGRRQQPARPRARLRLRVRQQHRQARRRAPRSSPPRRPGWDDAAGLTVLDGQFDTVPAPGAPDPAGGSHHDPHPRHRDRAGSPRPGRSSPRSRRSSWTSTSCARDGQWRISRLPDGVVVPLSIFRDNYRTVRTWFVDPVRRLAVADLRYVPSVPARAQAARVMELLLAGPSERARRAPRSRSCRPGAQLRSNVAMSPDGAVDRRPDPDRRPRRRPPASCSPRRWCCRSPRSTSARVRLLVDGEPLVAGRPDLTRDDVVRADRRGAARRRRARARRGGRAGAPADRAGARRAAARPGRQRRVRRGVGGVDGGREAARRVARTGRAAARCWSAAARRRRAGAGRAGRAHDDPAVLDADRRRGVDGAGRRRRRPGARSTRRAAGRAPAGSTPTRCPPSGRSPTCGSPATGCAWSPSWTGALHRRGGPQHRRRGGDPQRPPGAAVGHRAGRRGRLALQRDDRGDHRRPGDAGRAGLGRRPRRSRRCWATTSPRRSPPSPRRPTAPCWSPTRPACGASRAATRTPGDRSSAAPPTPSRSTPADAARRSPWHDASPDRECVVDDCAATPRGGSRDSARGRGRRGQSAGVDVRGLAVALVDLVLPGRMRRVRRAGRAVVPGVRTAPSGSARRRRPLLPGGPAVLAVGRYTGPLRTALLRYKERGRRDLAGPLAGACSRRAATRCRSATGAGARRGWCRRRPARRRRGPGAATTCCGSCRAGWPPSRPDAAGRAARSRWPAGPATRSGLDAAQRAANLAGRLRVRHAALPPPGSRVVLLDDVVTTGATLRACRDTLAAAGVTVAERRLCSVTPRQGETIMTPGAS